MHVAKEAAARSRKICQRLIFDIKEYPVLPNQVTHEAKPGANQIKKRAKPANDLLSPMARIHGYTHTRGRLQNYQTIACG